jgi:DNA-binding transcriptional ArsR family regulator
VLAERRLVSDCYAGHASTCSTLARSPPTDWGDDQAQRYLIGLFAGFQMLFRGDPSWAAGDEASPTCQFELRAIYYHSVMKPVGSEQQLDATFAALADATRRAILARLAEGDATVLELSEPFAMSQPAISKHLKVLQRAGLITRTRDAQRRPSRLRAAPLANVNAWLERYRVHWEQSFRRLDALLDDLQTTKAGNGTKKTARRKPR